jgi:hypothetical protein
LSKLYYICIACATISGVSALARAGEGSSNDGRELTDETKEEAKAYFVSGSEKFRAGLYREAIDDFQKAYALVRSPEILYNIGKCHEALKNDDEAIYHYEMYLRFYPTAEDSEDVRHRINVLRELKQFDEDSPEQSPVKSDLEKPTETKPDSKGGDKPKSKWWHGLRVGATMGATFPLLGEWERPLVPIDLFMHLKLAHSIYFCGLFTFGFAAGNESSSRNAEVDSAVGLFVGISALKTVHDRISLIGRAGALVEGLAREHHHSMATLLAGELGLGILIRVYEQWRLIGETMFDAGALFPGTKSTDPWGTSAGISLSIGGRIGVEYSF